LLKSYKDLLVWKKAYQLCLEVYKATKKFPAAERFVLVSQLRRAALSIPSNIAEGYGRRTTGEYIHSLSIAYGSVCELETQVMLSGDLGYLENEALKELLGNISEVERMIMGLIKSLDKKHLNP
jgi:four helix bundle protein